MAKNLNLASEVLLIKYLQFSFFLIFLIFTVVYEKHTI